MKPKLSAKAESPISVSALIALLIAANMLVLFALLPLPWMQRFFLIAAPFCPQRPAHSIFIGGQQMPIEARMFGMFSGALLALLYFAARGQLQSAMMPRGWRLALCIALFGVMAFDGTQALLFDTGLLRLYTPNLYLRLSTGLASGVGIAMVLVPLTNQALWQQPLVDRPMFTGWKDAAALAIAQAFLFALTFSNWAPALLPLSMFNSVGIIVVLTALMTMVIALIMRRSGQFTAWHATVGYFATGFILAVVFIAVLTTTRLALFGAGPLG
ncbi:MAG TPA: DUF2085 domain-containing protein [Anaerolineae bacterium]|jgi:uncharacterized membrane protein